MSLILGISGHFHDSASCLIRDGEIVAAAEEERFSRIKHDRSLPKAAVRYCLDEAGAAISDLDCVAYYERPTLKLARQLWMGLPELPSSRSRVLFRLDAMRPEREIRELLGYEGRIEFVGHHESHAAASYCCSGFEEAAILTVDGVGELTTTAYGAGRAGDVTLFEEVSFPHSLGLLYSTITSYLGFDVNDGEYKVMGLAAYGEPKYTDHIWSLVRLEDKGQYRLSMQYFDFVEGEHMYSGELADLFGQPPRKPGSAVDQFAKDLARSMQVVLEEILLAKVRYLHSEISTEHLCMGGGVALNCVANSRILSNGPFRRLFVCPAAGDSGGALGAAAIVSYRDYGDRVKRGALRGSLLGPRYSNDSIVQLFNGGSLQYEDFRGSEPELLRAASKRLADGAVLGWFHGRTEFGPRALGARSILADPRRAQMRDRINAVVKMRETFRPFAPAVPWPKASEHFKIDHPSPFMLETFLVTSHLCLAAVTHVDGTARVQTVDSDTGGRFYRLLVEFEATTGCPVLLNTSFNLRNEPIVCSPIDAIVCFIRSEMDCLILEDFLVDRQSLPRAWLNWREVMGNSTSNDVNEELYGFF